MPRKSTKETFNLISLWPLLIPVLILLPGITAFPYPSADAIYSDITITHYPNAVFLRGSILEYGQVPLWSPTILSGYPFFANPLSGLWYPPGWLALLLPLPSGFNLLVIAHLLIGGFGMYLFLRALDRSHLAALFGGLAFEAMPKIFAHYGAGHLTMVYAISLTPWLLLAEIRSWKSEGIFWLRQPGLVLALIALADPRWAMYAGLLWLAFSAVGSIQIWKAKLFWLLKQTLLAIAVAAPLLLPLIEYSQLSTRATLQPADVLASSLPPVGLLGFLAAPFGAIHEWVDYAGIVVLLLAIVSFLWSKKSKLDWLWIGLIGFSLAFSIGQNFPGLDFLTRLPGFSLLRVPPRILPLAGLALIIIATSAYQNVTSKNSASIIKRRLNLTMAAIISLLLVLSVTVWLATDQLASGFTWSMLVVLVLVAINGAYQRKLITESMFIPGLLILSIIDLGVADFALFSSRSPDKVIAEGMEVASFLSIQPGHFRVYSPSYSIPQHTAAAYGLELSDGVDPLQLQNYVDYMEPTTGVENEAYSITLPPFASSNPAIDNRDAVPDLDRLALLNVGFIASEFEVDLDGLEWIERNGQTNLYRVIDSKPRAFIERSTVSEVNITFWSPNRIEVDAQGPGQLVLSEIMYPGWVAKLDGKVVKIIPYQGILRSVNLPDGDHQVVFEFRPASLYFGGGLFVLATISVVRNFWEDKKRDAT